jgi:hypothetical protein
VPARDVSVFGLWMDMGSGRGRRRGTRRDDVRMGLGSAS